MNYTDFDRNHKNGFKRFMKYWRKVSEEKSVVMIFNNCIDDNIYTIQYCNDDDNEYISLIDRGVTFYFPMLTLKEDKESIINFDPEIVSSNLSDLIKLLNNKKNFTEVFR